MTNETTPSATSASEAAALLAAMTDTTATSVDTSAEAAPAEPKPPSFDDLALHADVKQALDDMGYFHPTPVQTAVFAPVTAGKDLLVQSRTGTGKTTAFGLPIINRLIPAHRHPQALILAPTRELALQVARELTQLGKPRGIIVEPVYGGAPIGKQISALKDGVHIIVGTPGRVLDHIGRRTLDCKTISTFVLDECDEMLSMGFLEDIERVTSFLPEKHQTLLFSATMPPEVERYSRRHMKTAEQLSLSRDSISVSEIDHEYFIVSGIARSRDLLKVIFLENPDSAIVFCNTRDETSMVAKALQKQGLDAEPLSSDLSQADRERVMGRMKAKNLRFLCATDVAARGIDISDLSHVINFTVPESPEVYVHRTGRTGRAGKKGTAISLVGPRELGNFRYVRLQYGIKPAEKVLPKDDIFVGKLKVPLPPLGAPTPPDPVQILIRGVTHTPTDLERQIFEKLYSTANGKRVLAALVAEKLDALSTRTAPRPRREREREREPREAEHGANGVGEERGIREERGPRDERGERPRRFGEDRGERGDREERPRRFGEDRGERGGRDERPRRFDQDRERGDRGERRFDRDRGERGERRFDRDRDRDRPRHERTEQTAGVAPAQDTTAPAPVVTAGETTTEERPVHRHEQHEQRAEQHEQRAEQHEQRAEQHEQRAEQHEQRAEAAPMPVTERVAKVEEPAHGRRHKKTTAPTEETREFWETWADNKAVAPAAPAPVAAPAAVAEAAPEAEHEERHADAHRDRKRGGKDTKDERRSRGKHEAKAEPHEGKAPRGKKDEPRSKRDTVIAPPPVAADGSQARLFVNLGKKHGVSADDLRTLLAGPIAGDTSRIGSVSLRDSHAHVRVPEELVDVIIAKVNGTSHGDHMVTVERARA